MEKVRFGLIGTGNAGEIHAKSLTEMKNALLMGVAGRNSQKTFNFAKKFHCQSFSSVDELLSSDIDAVCITTPSGTHAEFGVKAAQAGKHVMVEKPIDVNLKKADELIKACEKQKVKLGVISQRRFSQGVKMIMNVIQKGEMGEIGFAGAQVKWYRSQTYYDSADWRGRWDTDGGGALMNQSIHYVDLLRYFVGPIDEVFAYCKTMSHKIEVEDVAVGSLKFKNGAIGLVEATTAAYPGFFSRIDVYGKYGSTALVDDELEYIYSVKGKNFHRARKRDEKSKTVSSPHVSYELHKKQLENFVDAILQDEEPLINGKEGRNTLAVVVSMYESCKIGKSVKVETL